MNDVNPLIELSPISTPPILIFQANIIFESTLQIKGLHYLINLQRKISLIRDGQRIIYLRNINI